MCVPRIIALLVAPLTLACVPAGKPPNLVLVTLDTTRADHLGLYGYERYTSPELDELAKESRVYENAYSTSSWTLPSHASLFTGLYPSSHGARYDEDGELLLSAALPDRSGAGSYRAQPLVGAETLAEVLSAKG
jgi:arylsulfatase A-like enzyme